MRRVVSAFIRRWKLWLPLLVAALATGCAGYYGDDQPAGYAYYGDGDYDWPAYGYYGPDVYLYGGGVFGDHDHGHWHDDYGLHHGYQGRHFAEHGFTHGGAIGGSGTRTFGGVSRGSGSSGGFAHGGGHVGGTGHSSGGHNSGR